MKIRHVIYLFLCFCFIHTATLGQTNRCNQCWQISSASYKTLTGISVPAAYVTVLAFSIKYNGWQNTAQLIPNLFDHGRLGWFLAGFALVTCSNGLTTCWSGSQTLIKKIRTACRIRSKSPDDLLIDIV